MFLIIIINQRLNISLKMKILKKKKKNQKDQKDRKDFVCFYDKITIFCLLLNYKN